MNPRQQFYYADEQQVTYMLFMNVSISKAEIVVIMTIVSHFLILQNLLCMVVHQQYDQ
jgi:hypothetical protein